MKTFSPAFAALLAAALAAGQSLPPSPTASVGCEPHGDHWDCEGPASVTAVDTVTSTSVVATATNWHDDEEGTESLAPSPTESVGCEPHGDHWHCEGPASATTDAPAASTTSGHDDEDHAEGTGSLAPSPTESVGCEPHGDHWHCEGPASATTDAPAASTTSDHDEDHDDAEGTGSLAPSPTESVGCEPHGDHWHCDGPAETAAESGESSPSQTATGSGVSSPSQTADAEVDTAAAGELVLNKAVLAGALLAAIRLAL
ncbi:hypothetical protein DL768_003170 [Monosporascus sp. mg162]|nr:hypothetical protein DL768_003170 [Monosporascus sp. mg162]